MVHIHGGDVYKYKETADFSANINFRGMPERVREAAVLAIDRSVHYPEPCSRTLTAALAKRESVPSEAVFCGNGAAEVMFLLTAALRPRHAVLAQPCFFEYEQALESSGCAITHIMLNSENSFQVEASFLDQIPDDTDIVILGNPNNPTGQLIRAEVLERIQEYCWEREIMLVVDESFIDFLSEEDLAKTMECTKRIADTKKLFVLKSFTKMYAMPGLRFGYGISGDPELIARMYTLAQPWNVSLPAQMAAKAAVEETGFARDTARQTAVNRKWMLEQMRAHGFDTFDSCTNYLLFRGDPMLRDTLVKKGFLIRDCSNFRGLEDIQVSVSHTVRYYRICVRSQEENEELLAALIGSRHRIRTARMEDLDRVTEMEAECFPPAEAASRERIRGRLEVFGDYFWLLEEGDTVIGFVNGMVSNRPHLVDEMYEDASMHEPDGAWQMIFSVGTMPEYRRQGCAAAVLEHVIARAREQGRKGLVLTCKDHMIHYYARFGFVDEGISDSEHGKAVWHEMRLTF